MTNCASEVIDFIAYEAGVPPATVTRETRLWHDLRLCGDDLDDVFERFRKKFNVDLSRLSLANCGPSETTVFCIEAWRYLAEDIPGLSRVSQPQYRPITVGELIRAAEAKTWDIVC